MVTQKKRIQFENWIRSNYRNERTMKILFLYQIFFSVDGVYNAQNDRIWATNRVDASKRSGVKRKRKFPAKVMVWLGACSIGISPIVIFETGTLNQENYIEKVLPVAKKFGNKLFGND